MLRTDTHRFVFSDTHRFVFVASDRQRIASIGGRGNCCSRHSALVRSRSSVACVRAGGYAGTSQIGGRTRAALPDHRPRGDLAATLPTGNAGRNRHEPASKVSAPADIRG